MTTQQLLETIASEAFGTAFQEEICNIYHRDAEAGKLDTTETEYSAAMDHLSGTLTSEKLGLLTAYEALCKQIREFSASYGFQAGLFCGFKQYFTPDDANDGGFCQHVDEKIAAMPNMKQHPENYQNIQRRNALHAALCEGESEAVQEQLTALDLAWSQRGRSASIHGFYCGYRGAMAIIDKVMLAGGGSFRIINKLLTMEHHLGYIQSFAEIERAAAAPDA